MKPWSELDARERDAAVAEHVMGWRPMSLANGMEFFSAGGNEMFVGRNVYVGDKAVTGWSPSTDPIADYEVLRHVRESWGFGLTDCPWLFGERLEQVLRSRTTRCVANVA